MSLSNPSEKSQNPSTRWFDWNGEKGIISYYDKDKKVIVPVPLPFTFILLDELATVRGWDELSKSGIYSNEVKDTRTDILTVKAFKGGTIAEGLYRDIKDRVNSKGGSYSSNCYLAFKGDDGLVTGVLRFKGAALGAWMDFKKNGGRAFTEKAVTIDGTVEGKKGRVTFYVPKFSLMTISAETLSAAVDLDKELQEYLKGYLAHNRKDQAEFHSQERPDADDGTDFPTDDDLPANF